MNGNTGSNYLTGGSNEDMLISHDGNDALDGGTGVDTLIGGIGRDLFVFNSALGASNVDGVTDFSVPDDTVWLRQTFFAQAGAGGALAASAFHIGAAAADVSDRIVYNSATGALSYDSDGLGGAGQVQFATLDAGLAMTAADFYLV